MVVVSPTGQIIPPVTKNLLPPKNARRFVQTPNIAKDTTTACIDLVINVTLLSRTIPIAPKISRDGILVGKAILARMETVKVVPSQRVS